MTRLRWLLRRELIVGDVLLCGGILANVLAPLVFGRYSETGLRLSTIGFVAAGYGSLWLLVVAWLFRTTDVTARWLITRVIMRIADMALLAPIFFIITAPRFGGGIGYREPTLVEQLTLIAVLVVGYLGIIFGWTWIRRINRGEPEPEANDRFWWSRA